MTYHCAKECIRTAWNCVVTDAAWPFQPEVAVCENRKWRFDWADPNLKLAIEINGVVYSKGRTGRHQNAVSLASEYEKLNTAACTGWLVLIFTPQMVNSDPFGCVNAIINAAALQRSRTPERQLA